MGAKIPNTDYYLNWARYRYQRWKNGFGYIASVIHPNEDDQDTRPPQAGDTKPALLYSDNELLCAISQADSLEELKEALRKNKERIDEVPEWKNLEEV